MESRFTLFVVDDDAGVLEAFRSVAQLMRLQYQGFLSAEEFLAAHEDSNDGCLVIDVNLPGMNGLDLQRQLKSRNISLPVIMISGRANVKMATQAMRNEAITFLQKPFSLDELVNNIDDALRVAQQQRNDEVECSQARDRFARMSSDECQYLHLLWSGDSERQIAAKLNWEFQKLEIIHHQLFQTLEIQNLVELNSLFAKAGVEANYDVDNCVV